MNMIMESNIVGSENMLVVDGKRFLITTSIRILIEQVKAAFSCNLSVLIKGGIGTGKSLIVRLAVSEAGKKMVRINISTINPELLMSELFGHRKGSFSGAIEEREGLIATAKDGVLFIDEVGDLSFEAQAALLDLLEEGVYKSVGSDTFSRFRGKIVTATHKNLEQMVEEGLFREDLYSRIKNAVIEIPRISENAEEIILYANFFLGECNIENNESVPKKFGKGVEAKILARELTYGIRDIKGMIRMAYMQAGGSEYIMPDNLPEGSLIRKKTSLVNFLTFNVDNHEDFQQLLDFCNSSEKLLMEAALKLTNGVKTEAAKLCGFSRRAFQYKSLQYQLGTNSELGDEGRENKKEFIFVPVIDEADKKARGAVTKEMPKPLNGKNIPPKMTEELPLGIGSFIKWEG